MHTSIRLFLIALQGVVVFTPAKAEERFDFTGRRTGPAQFQITAPSGVDSEAHSVTPIALAVEQGGRVSGSSPENGCTFLGIGRPGVTERMFDLDLTASKCKYEKLNVRYSGSLIATPAEGRINFTLRSTVSVLGPNLSREIKGNLKRF